MQHIQLIQRYKITSHRTDIIFLIDEPLSDSNNTVAISVCLMLSGRHAYPRPCTYVRISALMGVREAQVIVSVLAGNYKNCLSTRMTAQQGHTHTHHLRADFCRKLRMNIRWQRIFYTILWRKKSGGIFGGTLKHQAPFHFTFWG
jgi:hypothetical protein